MCSAASRGSGHPWARPAASDPAPHRRGHPPRRNAAGHPLGARDRSRHVARRATRCPTRTRAGSRRAAPARTGRSTASPDVEVRDRFDAVIDRARRAHRAAPPAPRPPDLRRVRERPLRTIVRNNLTHSAVGWARQTVRWMPIVPDHKNWTWVLDGLCTGLRATTRAATVHGVGRMAEHIRANADAWPAPLAHPHATLRPTDDQWSTRRRAVIRQCDAQSHNLYWPQAVCGRSCRTRRQPLDVAWGRGQPGLSASRIGATPRNSRCRISDGNSRESPTAARTENAIRPPTSRPASIPSFRSLR